MTLKGNLALQREENSNGGKFKENSKTKSVEILLMIFFSKVNTPQFCPFKLKLLSI
jgi:hypothetical protein